MGGPPCRPPQAAPSPALPLRTRTWRCPGRPAAGAGGRRWPTLRTLEAGVAAVLAASCLPLALGQTAGVTADQSWAVSAGITFRLSITGQGLTSADTLRIIPGDQSCTSNSNSPNMELSLQVGCPLTCAAVSAGVPVALQVLSYNTVNCDASNRNCNTVYVRKITVISASYTEIEFDSPPGLSDGDRLMLGSGIACLSNCVAADLTLLKGAATFGYPVNATGDANRFWLPVGWSSSPAPTFTVTANQGQWSRTSAASTAEEIYGTTARAALRVCWYSATTGAGEAGLLNINTVPIMRAEAALTSSVVQTVAPLIISFRTSTQAAYSSPKNPMYVNIVFNDVSVIAPYYSNGEPIEDGTTPPEPSRNLCGRLFREMWSSDPNAGFPLPIGCTHRPVLQTYELHLLLDARNALHGGQDYQVVIMAMVGTTGTGGEVMQVYSMDDVQLRPYLVVEMGRSSLNHVVYQRSSGAGPRFGPQGLQVIGGTNALYELRDQLDLQIQISGDPTGKIIRQQLVRLFMHPLTLWDMQPVAGATSCTATCIPYAQTRCSGLVPCSVESVTSGGQHNILKIEMPADMDDISGDTRHTISVRGLTLPATGFFPTRISAQVTMPDGSQPDYIISGGDLIFKRPDAGTSVAELVTRAGDSNTKPFEGDVGNVLHLHLSLGVTLQVMGQAGSASLSVTMPPGYIGRGVAATPSTLSLWSAESALLGKGTPDLDEWACAGNVCTYSLQLYDIVPAGWSFFVSFIVDNPGSALQQEDPANQWSLSMTSTGYHSAPQPLAGIPFRPATEVATSNFDDAVPVLGKLAGACAQPGLFAASPNSSSPVSHQLRVFFTAEQTTGPGGSVILDAPAGFDFGAACACGALDASYYNPSAPQRTRPLPEVSGCVGSAPAGGAVLNRAAIQLLGNLQAGRTYGFQITVKNPQAYSASQQAGWRLWTRTRTGYYVDGTATQVAFNIGGGPLAGPADSWGMYQMDLPTLPAITLSSLKPYRLTGQEAVITVFPLSVPSDVQTTLRVTAPLGYEWYFTDQDFIYKSNATTGVAAASVPGATADLPGRLPTKAGNELTWPVAAYLQMYSYGFVAKIRVPDFSPTASSNEFFIEFGYADRAFGGGLRVAAARVPVPAVRALTNARVDYTTNLVGKVNTLQFTIATVTDVPTGGGLLVRGPPGFQFPDACVSRSISGSALQTLPNDVMCSTQVAAGGEVQLRLTAGDAGIPAGLYGFELTGVNPTSTSSNFGGMDTSCGWTLCWTFHSLQVMRLGLESPELDARLSAPGFAIKGSMLGAGLAYLDAATLLAIGRNDRPLQPNRLAVWFQLNQDMNGAGLFVLKGPAGFIFDEDCLANGGVNTDPSIYGASASQALQKQGSWEPGVSISSCVGDGPIAQIQVSDGLLQGKPYVFTIRIRSNPEETPLRNQWTLESPDESSPPIDGFALWTFTGVAVTTLTSAASVSGAMQNMVNITFRPRSTVAPPGTLLLTAPSGFTFQSRQCPMMLQELDPIQAALSPGSAAAAPTAFLGSEMKCWAQATRNAIMVQLNGTTSIVAGRDYTLIVAVDNPPTVSAPGAAVPSWTLASYTSFARTSALDTVTAPGFAISRPLSRWAYRQTADFAPDGGAQLAALVLLLTFGEAVGPSDTIVITAPPGFSLDAPDNRAGERRCRGMQWTGTYAGLLNSSTAAVCDANRMTISIGASGAVPADTPLQLQVSTSNPSLSPVWTANIWLAQHRNQAGAVLSEAAFQGWRVVPQLLSVQVALVDQPMAGDVASLAVAFIAATSAESVLIKALQPAGFDFSQAVPAYAVQTLLEGLGSSVSVQAKIVAGGTTSVRLDRVSLAPKGGPTVFDITTFDANGNIADRKLGFAGFRLPGSIAVSEPVLQSQYQRNAGGNPVKAAWPPQTGVAGTASFKMVLSNAAAPGETFNVVGDPFELVRQGFQIVDLQTQQVVPAVVAIAGGGGYLKAQLQDGLKAQRPYRLSVGVVTQQTPGAAAKVWSIYTSDGGDLPSSRNSNIATGFKLVSSFIISAQATRSPPMAAVEVTLSMALGTATVGAFVVVAPPTFAFAPDCLVSGGSAATSCRPLPSSAYFGLPAARLEAASGGATGITVVKVQVMTPQVMPSNRSWFLSGIAVDSIDQVGWGEDAVGFDVTQMRDASIVYPGVPGVDAQLSVSFHTSETVDRGGRIQLTKPPELGIFCISRDDLWPMNLPGVVQCQVNATSVILTLNGTLSPGLYAFALRSRSPAVQPVSNSLSLLLRDRKGAVQDAAMNVAGQTLQPSVAVANAQLSWTSADAGQASTITVTFSVTSNISKNVLGSMLITFPQNFEHAIEKESMVISQNSKLPLYTDSGATGWVDISMVDRLSIRLDSTRDITNDTYGFQFPVTVPETLPPSNVWLLTFCGASDSGGACQQATSTQALVTFPLAGFTFGEVSTVTGGPSPRVSAARSRSLPLLSWASLALFALALR